MDYKFFNEETILQNVYNKGDKMENTSCEGILAVEIYLPWHPLPSLLVSLQGHP